MWWDLTKEYFKGIFLSMWLIIKTLFIILRSIIICPRYTCILAKGIYQSFKNNYVYSTYLSSLSNIIGVICIFIYEFLDIWQFAYLSVLFYTLMLVFLIVSNKIYNKSHV